MSPTAEDRKQRPQVFLDQPAEPRESEADKISAFIARLLQALRRLSPKPKK